MPENNRDDCLVEARNLVKYYPIRGGVFLKQVAAVKAVDDVSLTIRDGETMGLVGESGCGKTTFGRAILRLEEPTAGEVIFKGRNLLACDSKEMRGLRKQMQIIFQDPFSSLNPRKTIAQIIGEPLLVHGLKSRKQREERVLELLDVVGLRPEQMRRYPHMFSGGPGRFDTSPGAQSAQGPAARVRPDLPFYLTRSARGRTRQRPCCGYVSGEDRRAGPQQGPLQKAAAPLFSGASLCLPHAGSEVRTQAHYSQG
jgi:hypothetical protein